VHCHCNWAIECNVRNIKVGADVLVKQIVENIARADITPLEEADAFQELRDTFGMDADTIAAKLGLAPFRVRWRVQLLNLAPEIRKMVASGDLDRQQGMEIARLDKHADQSRIVRLINRQDLVGWKAVRNAVEAIINGTTQADIFGAAAPASRSEDLKVVRSMEQRVEQIAVVVALGWKDGQSPAESRPIERR
jgi:ParB family transcriptional regulator, chromosome partitioning protein